MYGWICPKCGRVYGPTMMECCSCNNTNTNWSVTSTSIAKEDYEKWKEKHANYEKPCGKE